MHDPGPVARRAAPRPPYHPRDPTPVPMRRLAVFFAALLAAAPVAAQSFVVANARVHTVDDARPEAQAFAVVDGHFAIVGTTDAVRRAYPNLPVHDLRGTTVVPGLIDAHGHLMGLAQTFLSADLVGTTSKTDVIARLHAFGDTLAAGRWIVGRGWDQNDWPAAADGSHPFPTRADLDAAFPDRPVYLTRIDGHAAWANTAALRAAGGLGSLARVADTDSGRQERNAQGVPTGVMVDEAMALVGQHVPEPSDDDLDRALTAALAQTARLGLTGVHDMGVDLRTVDLYRRRIAAGTFPLRVAAYIGGRGATFDRFCNRPILGEDGRLWLRGVKFYADGALGSRGAALLAPYTDAHDQRGLLFQDEAAWRRDFEAAKACGYQSATHAIGDRAGRVVLDAYAAVGRRADRNRVEHAQVLTMPDLRRFARLGVIASMQPTHATSDLPWADQRLGPVRIAGAYAWQTVRRSGGRLALGSDFPVEHPDPLRGFYAAIVRRPPDLPAGQRMPATWHLEQRLSRAQTLRGFTLDAAYAGQMEDVVGSIAPGKLADFVVLSADPMTASDEALKDLRVTTTVLGGTPIYGTIAQ